MSRSRKTHGHADNSVDEDGGNRDNDRSKERMKEERRQANGRPSRRGPQCYECEGWGLSRKIWSGVKIGPGGHFLLAKIGPPMQNLVRAENWNSVSRGVQKSKLSW